MALHPSVVCESAEHASLQSVAIVFLIFWSAGIPVVMIWLLYWLWNNRPYDINNTSNFGILVSVQSRFTPRPIAYESWQYIKYVPRARSFAFELVTMSRRAVIAALVTLLSEPGLQLLQVTLAVIAFAGYLALHTYLRPFVDDKLNYLERTALLSHLSVSALGIIFVPGARHGVMCAGGFTCDTARTESNPVADKHATGVGWVLIWIIVVPGFMILRHVMKELSDTLPLEWTTITYWRNELFRCCSSRNRHSRDDSAVEHEAAMMWEQFVFLLKSPWLCLVRARVVTGAKRVTSCNRALCQVRAHRFFEENVTIIVRAR